MSFKKEERLGDIMKEPRIEKEKISPKKAALERVRLLTPHKIVAALAEGKRVLDIGCGEGHEANLLARYASQVIAIDVSPNVVGKARENYGNQEGLTFKVMNGEHLLLPDNSFGIVVSFEVIEHVFDPYQFLRGIKRVVNDDELVFITTPNRRVRLLPFQKPWNPEQKRGFSKRGFEKLLKAFFPEVIISGIIGQHAFQDYYRNLWKQSPLKVYGRRLLPKATRTILKRIRGAYGSNLIPDMQKHQPLDDALIFLDQEWPFFTNPNDLKHCLNFFAICTLDKSLSPEILRRIYNTSSLQ